MAKDPTGTGRRAAGERRAGGAPAEWPLLGDAGYARVKRAIVDCELLPGEAISLPRIVERYGLTAAQARHALVRLTQEGWVSTIPRKGYLVAPLTLQDLNDVFELRLLLEPTAMRRAAGRLSPAAVTRLRKSTQLGYRAGDPESIREFLQHNREFYIEIVRATGNKHLTRVIDNLFDSVNRLLYFSMLHVYESQVIRQAHEDLLDAVATGDGDGAERLRREALMHAQETIQQALLSSPSLMATNLAPQPAAPGRRSA
jgi:DNA-binding GntR family transcriptional regulator